MGITILVSKLTVVLKREPTTSNLNNFFDRSYIVVWIDI